MPYVLGCDVGSQGLKVVLCDHNGNVLGSAYRDYPILYPKPTWAEQDARFWLQALEDAVREVILRAAVDPHQVKALGISGYVDAVVPIDPEGNPLRPCFLWMDRRAVDECEEIARRIDPRQLWERTGLNLDPSHVAPKILWIKKHEPEVWARTWRLMMPTAFVVYHLTGKDVLDFSNASSTLLLDIRRRTWDVDICHLLDVPENLLPSLRPATDIAGTLRPEWADRLGLTSDVVVPVGSGDEHAACIGAGVVEPGLVCDIGGTAEPVCAVAQKPLFDPTGLVETHCHADPNTWLLENPGFVSGANLRWYRDQFGLVEVESARRLGVDSYDLLTLQAAKAPPGCEGVVVLPCFMGAMTPEWNAAARGVIYGLTLAHGRHHLIRAILEASAFGVRDITDRMAEMGLAVRELRVVGGAARSWLWRQIKADVTGIPVALPAETDSTALGAALMGMVAAGLAGSLVEAAQRAVRIVARHEPDPEARKTYEQAYARYRAVYEHLRPMFAREWIKAVQ